MKIAAIRHLRTEWNAQGLLQGHSDIPLALDDQVNHKLAASLKDQLAELSIDQILVSPFKRAVQTADFLGLDGYKIEPLVEEMSFGKWEGLPKQEMISAFNGKWETDPLSTELRENLELLEQRIQRFLGQLDPDQSTLIISHGAFIRALKSILETGSIHAMNQTFLENGELYCHEE